MKQRQIPRDMTPENFAALVDYVQTLATSITVGDNVSGQIVEDVSVPAASEVKVSHSLKSVPKYKLILRNDQDIVDGDSPWNDKYITLKNAGATDATVSVLILRG